ncbi:MAG TPA: NAD(P)/FAD-dependent oxidoreductase [Chloroflexia bacterium]|nr:NAD(P)/FAD-dependent oxidoreductase [Chloroflexia bacterium]
MNKKVALGLVALGGGLVLARRLASNGPLDAPAHHSQTEEAYLHAEHRVLILGASFGGLQTALALDRRLPPGHNTSILVVNQDNDMLFTPLLWTVADGRAAASDVLVPIRAFQRGRAFHVLHAGVIGIDLDKRVVETTSGPRPYDVLVIALGSVTALPNLPGLREHARLFHTTGDALQMRNHLIDAIEQAHQTEDPDERRAWLTFVVGGGGDTGIELAATIHDYLETGLLAKYPWLSDTPPHIVIAGRADRLLPMSTPRTSASVRRVLESSGIEVRTGVSVTGATDRVVQTDQGDIPARTLFWAAGITAPPVVHDLPVDHARNGALLVDDHLRIPQHPEVYVVGDAAWAYDSATGNPIPPTAQAAEHEGQYVGRAIAAELAGQPAPPFRFEPKGHLALLGKRTGVAEIGPLTFTGLPAWFMWHGYYLLHIPSWRNRLHLLTDWFLAGLTGRDTAQLRLGGEAEELVLPARKEPAGAG